MAVKYSSLARREEHRLRVTKSKLLRRISVPMRREATYGWEHNCVMRIFIRSLHQFFPCGSTVLGEPWPPLYVRFRNHSWAFDVTPWTRCRSIARPLYPHRTTQHRNTRTNIHALSGIRTHNHSIQSVKLRDLDHVVTVIGHHILLGWSNEGVRDWQDM
jgi:hypothetical protein